MKNKYFSLIVLLIIGLVAVLAGCAQTGLPAGDYSKVYQREMPTLSLDNDGKFKILQITDTHFFGGNNLSDKETFQKLKKVVSDKKYDLVVLTGDIFEGKTSKKYDKLSAVNSVIKLFNENSQKFTYVSGNNDGEILGSDKDIILQFLSSENFVFSDTKLQGCGNFYIKLVDNEGQEKHRMVMFDTSHRDNEGQYIPIGKDQIDWYAQITNDAKSLGISHSFFGHIPFNNIESVINQGTAVVGDDNLNGIKTFWAEMGNQNDALFAVLKENKCTLVVSGHMHNIDVAKKYENIIYKITRSSGVYNKLGKDFANGVCEITIDTNQTDLEKMYTFNTITY